MEPERSHRQQHCEDCSYFREDELDTGYCQFHNMFVLRIFGCQNFIQHLPVVPGGGEAQGRIEEDDNKEC